MKLILTLATTALGLPHRGKIMKRCLFLLFCATALFARIPTADAYTVIVVSSSSSNGGGEHYPWRYNPIGPNVSRSVLEQLALKRCRGHGGINP